MEREELKQFLNMMLTNYNKPFDVNISTLWEGLFIHFDARIFRAACYKVIAFNKFFPNASEIIDAYQQVKQKSEHERYEKLRENQRLLSSGQAYCYLCDNSGCCLYTVSGCEYMARCICSHGQDLNKFTESQINHQHKPERREYYSERDKTAIKRGGNPFYILTIKETLKDDYTIFEARKKEQYLSRETVDNKQKAEILKMIGCV